MAWSRVDQSEIIQQKTLLWRETTRRSDFSLGGARDCSWRYRSHDLFIPISNQMPSNAVSDVYWAEDGTDVVLYFIECGSANQLQA